MDDLLTKGWIRDEVVLILVASAFLWLGIQNKSLNTWTISLNALLIVFGPILISFGIIYINSILRDVPLITERENALLLFFALFLIGGTYLLNKNWGYIYAADYVCISVIFLLIMSITTPYLGTDQGSNRAEDAKNAPRKFYLPHPFKPKYDPHKPLQVNVENAIRSFQPSKQCNKERDYHDELYNWLKRDFPYVVEYEVQTGSSRPDLVIKNIAIEIKGPTGKRELDTIATKLLKYSQYYPYFIVVLFDCNFSEGHYNEIYSAIRKNFPRVHIIRK